MVEDPFFSSFQTQNQSLQDSGSILKGEIFIVDALLGEYSDYGLIISLLLIYIGLLLER